MFLNQSGVRINIDAELGFEFIRSDKRRSLTNSDHITFAERCQTIDRCSYVYRANILPMQNTLFGFVLK